MPDYATISKRLRRYSENCVAYKLDADFANAVTDAADAIEELIDELTTIRKQFPRWISVEERLPEKYESVITANKNGDVRWNYLINVKYGTWSNGYHITHWMPLPAPPTEPKEG